MTELAALTRPDGNLPFAVMLTPQVSTTAVSRVGVDVCGSWGEVYHCQQHQGAGLGMWLWVGMSMTAEASAVTGDSSINGWAGLCCRQYLQEWFVLATMSC